MQSELSPSYPSGSSRPDSSTARGGAPSSAVVASGSSGNTCGTTAFDSKSSGGVYSLAPRPKRPWDDISPAGNDTTATAFMCKQPTLSGVASASGGGTSTGAKEACGGALAMEGGGTSKGGVVINLVDSPSIAAPSIHSSSATAAAAGSSSSSSTSGLSVMQGGGNGISEDDLADSDEKSVIARLAEFTEMARRTAVQNEELSRELVYEKRRVVHTNRKLEQCTSTCAELRESLALAQDTVIKLREHEMAWAERTANEMSLRAELCALKDEYSSVSSDAAVLKKRCEAFQLENTELGERFAAIAEEKRQVESRARRLLRSERCRSY